MRLIDADELIAKVTRFRDLAKQKEEDTPVNFPSYRTYSAQANERHGFIGMIDNAPTIKTFTLADSERPQGEWIEHSSENLLWGHNECPFCHMRSNRGAHYCQYCGAYMKGGAEND